MHYEVDVTIPAALDERNRRKLEAAERSANRIVRFEGDTRGIRLTVDVAGQSREEAIRSAVREVARLFPASDDERYGEPRRTSA
jgi:hypothetical protein